MFDSGPWLVLPLLLLTLTIKYSLDHKWQNRYLESEEKETFWFFWLWFRWAYDSSYASNFRFSLGHKCSDLWLQLRFRVWLHCQWKPQWATKVLRHFVILEYLRQISFLISTILPPPPFSMLDFLSLEFASFLYNIEKGEGGWLSI